MMMIMILFEKFRSPTSSFVGLGNFEILFWYQIRYDLIQFLNELGVMAVFDETFFFFEFQFPLFPIF